MLERGPSDHVTGASCHKLGLLWPTRPSSGAWTAGLHQTEVVHTWPGPRRPWRHKLPKWPQCPLSVLQSCALSPCPQLCLRRSSLGSGYRGTEDLGLVYRRFCAMLYSYHQKMDTCSTTISLWVIPEGQCWTTSPCGKNFDLHSWLPFLGRRNGQRSKYLLIHRLWPKVWLNGQGLGRNLIRKLVTRKFREKDRQGQKKKKRNIYVPCECPKDDLSNGWFKNQVNRVTC